MMNKRRWTKDENQTLIENYHDLKISDLVNLLSRSEDSIRWQASKLSLTSEKPTLYTPSELVFIEKSMKTMSITQMSKHLNRTEKGIRNQITKIRQVQMLKDSESIIETKFDDNIPYGLTKSHEFKTLLNSMSVGQSFEYPSVERQTMANVISLFTEKIFKSKKVDSNSRRVWRIF